MAVYDATIGGGTVLELSVNQDSQDVANNVSSDSWSLALYRGSAISWTFGDIPYSININGANYTGTFNFDFRSEFVHVIATGTTAVGHNPDGTKSPYVAAWIGDTGTAVGGNVTIEGTFNQTTIPRATTATLSSSIVAAGDTVTIGLAPASGSFTHDVDYGFGSMSGRILTGVTTGGNWTIPLSLLTQIPNATLGVGTIRVTTYSSGVLVGQKDTTIGISAGGAAVPSFTTVTATEATAGLATNVGAFVQNLSKLNLAITGAAGFQGSTITGYKIVVTGQTINAVSGTTPAVISASGTVPIVATVTDSRGRTASKTVNVTVLPYGPPVLTTATAQRALSDGTVDDQGTYIRVDLNAAVQSLIVSTAQKNAIVYRISTRPHGGSTWTVKATTTPGGVTFNNHVSFSGYPIEDSFDTLIEVMDDFSTSAVTLIVPTAAIFMHWDASDGVGVGKFRENGMLDVAGPIYQNDGHLVLDDTKHFAIMATGSALAAGHAAASNVNVSVTFPVGLFPTAPTVMANSENARNTCSVSSITTSGCVISNANWSPATVGDALVYWLAVIP